MKRLVTVSFIAASLMLSGCSATSEDSPLVSKAQGLGEEKVEEDVFHTSQFEEIYQSTNGTISFVELDNLEWQVKRQVKGKDLPKGDNFQATTTFNFSYYTVIDEWVKTLKEQDGWKASNELIPKPREMEKELYEGSRQDYRAMNPYEVDLKKGKTTIKVRMSGENEIITLTVNSQ